MCFCFAIEYNFAGGNPASLLLTASRVAILVLVIYDVAPLRHDYFLNVENTFLGTLTQYQFVHDFHPLKSCFEFVVHVCGKCIDLSIKNPVGSLSTLFAPRLQLSATVQKAQRDTYCKFKLKVCFKTMNVSSPFPNDTGIILQDEMIVCYFASKNKKQKTNKQLKFIFCLQEAQVRLLLLFVCLIAGSFFESNDLDSFPRSNFSKPL